MAEFIPKQYKKEQFTIRMDREMLKRVDQLAEEYQLSRSDFSNQRVSFALEPMPKDNRQE